MHNVLLQAWEPQQKVTPALVTQSWGNYLSARANVLANKAHETSASWNDTLLSYSPSAVGSNYTRQHGLLHDNLLGMLICNNFMAESSFQEKKRASHAQCAEGP